MDDIILSTQNGEPVASSRDVAKRFGKEHKHVLAAIRQLLVAENSATKFFHETEFEYRGQKFPEYLMNRDGFPCWPWALPARKPCSGSSSTSRPSTRWRSSWHSARSFPARS